MEKDVNATHESSEALANESKADASFPDTKALFELWLDTLKPSQHSTSSQFPGVEEQAADFFVECDEGTVCRIEFTGVLNIGGVFSGSLRTDSGTLVTHTPGRINADIDVAGKVFIDSAVKGNINATGRVVLNSNAKVVGNINAHVLSIENGADVEGDWVFPEDLGNVIRAASTEASAAVGAIAVAD
jgi:cytoskeletal protein CcmA (bactofilin family)